MGNFKFQWTCNLTTNCLLNLQDNVKERSALLNHVSMLHFNQSISNLSPSEIASSTIRNQIQKPAWQLTKQSKSKTVQVQKSREPSFVTYMRVFFNRLH